MDKIKEAIREEDVSDITAGKIETKGYFKIYEISGNSVTLYAHSYPQGPEQIESFWSLTESLNVNTIIRLAHDPFQTEYLPAPAMKSVVPKHDQGQPDSQNNDDTKTMLSGIKVTMRNKVRTTQKKQALSMVTGI